MEELLAKFEEHNKFLDEYFAKNKFIASGHLDNKTGAIINVKNKIINIANILILFVVRMMINFNGYS
ncbi:hypothetical protein [Snodgrassella sp. M0351]|uniref:hypothetical protein n=1 Tax=Snodgrassella sp. M0351 TaxID=2751012 RepID=UPI0018DD9BFB|nr:MULTISPECIES: hypothetical protein [Snodgrassella]MBI0165153.1 hypothetical protein [Snodgrassella sp. M0351]